MSATPATAASTPVTASVSTDSATHMSVGDAITAEQIADAVAGGDRSPAFPETAAYALQLADDSLILSQRLGWWISRAPEMEEDIALGNIALDILGHARFFYTYAGTAWGRTEDDLAYFRAEEDFRSTRLVEQPGQDFGQAIARQLIFSFYTAELYKRLSASTDPVLAAIADKAVKEVAYHVDHATQWLLRLGLGTDESHARMQDALDVMWPYKDELFADTAEALAAEQAVPGSTVSGADMADMKTVVDGRLTTALRAAGLEIPDVKSAAFFDAPREGAFSEYRGFILTELQSLARRHPGATW